MTQTTVKKIDSSTLKTLKLCCLALDDKKAEELVLLDVRGNSSITNFLVLATGNSEPHLRALSGELERVFKQNKISLVGLDAEPGSGWVVLDAFDLMVHLFTAEQRSTYRLESLWKDAHPVDVEPLLKPDEAPKPKAPRKRASAAKKNT